MRSFDKGTAYEGYQRLGRKLSQKFYEKGWPDLGHVGAVVDDGCDKDAAYDLTVSAQLTAEQREYAMAKMQEWSSKKIGLRDNAPPVIGEVF